MGVFILYMIEGGREKQGASNVFVAQKGYNIADDKH